MQIPRPLRFLPFFAAFPTVSLAFPAGVACEGANRLSVDAVLTSAAPDLDRLRDGRVAAEGSAWDGPLAVRLESPGGEVLVDLRAPVELRSALLQADADDRYFLDGSIDGFRFEPLAEARSVAPLSGLRSRALSFPAASVRFVRIRSGGGDGRASLSELQLFCTGPEAWATRLQVVDDPAAIGSGSGRRALWNDVTSRWWELSLALGTLAFLAAARRHDDRPERRRRWNVGFGALLALSILTYFNFGAFHFRNFLHGWDTFHYYLGAKYFRELRYDGLYDCVAIADAADPARRPAVERRTIRDLRENRLVPATDVLARPETCTGRFTAERWRAFAADVAWFRGRETPARWDEMSADHGFNGTPVWMILGSTLASLAPATQASAGALALLDPLLFLAMVVALVRGFGLRAAAVALAVLSTSFPSRFFWTGGAYLRWDWLFLCVLALALARRGRPMEAGVALAWASLLRLFPAVLFLAPLAGLAAALRRGLAASDAPFTLASWKGALAAPEARPPLRFLAGAALAAVLLVPVSFAATGGPRSWTEFAANTVKHKSTPLTNNMGLATVLTWRPDEVGRRLHSEAAAEPWGRWKEARLAARAPVLPIQAALLAAAVTLLFLCARRRAELWELLALAALAIPFALETTCYYYAFLLLPALLWRRRSQAATILLALSAAGQFLSLAPIPGMPTWRDEVYTALSLLTVVAAAGILLLHARHAVPEPESACPNVRQRMDRPRHAAAPARGQRRLTR